MRPLILLPVHVGDIASIDLTTFIGVITTIFIISSINCIIIVYWCYCDAWLLGLFMLLGLWVLLRATSAASDKIYDDAWHRFTNSVVYTLLTTRSYIHTRVYIYSHSHSTQTSRINNSKHVNTSPYTHIHTHTHLRTCRNSMCFHRPRRVHI